MIFLLLVVLICTVIGAFVSSPLAGLIVGVLLAAWLGWGATRL